jgi:intraflagellar transport protein 81
MYFFLCREDAEDLSAALSAMERDNEAARETAERGLAARADSNIMMFRQQAALAAKKLEERIAQAENLALEREGLAEEAELLAAAAEASMSMTAGNSGGLMSREELKAYGSRLREKTLVYKRLKAELAALRAETVVIGRTEQVLRSRDDRLEDFLSELEDRRGVGGYRQAQAELVERSEAAAAADSGKAQTLQEISNLVNVITKELQGRKADLQEQVAALKRARAEVAELEGTHGAAQAKYDQLAVGFEVERQSIEAECDRLQEEALAEESRYHSLSSLNSILSAQLARVKQEEAWKSGEGRLLPDFRCYKDLYEHKLRQQESLSKQLRRQQKSIREKEGGNTVQRKLFDDLHSLLHGKMAVKKLQVVAANKRKDHIDEAFIKTIDAQYGGGGAGGANVLTL